MCDNIIEIKLAFKDSSLTCLWGNYGSTGFECSLRGDILGTVSNLALGWPSYASSYSYTDRPIALPPSPSSRSANY